MKLCKSLITIILIYLLAISCSLSQTQIGTDIIGEAAGDRSGQAVAIDSLGNRVAIGGPSNTANGTHAGHVRVCEWRGGRLGWRQMGSDLDGASSYDYYGDAVSLSADGNTLAIGGAGYNSSIGHVHVFDWVNNSWVQRGQDISGSGLRNLGKSVALSSDGNIIVIGAPGIGAGQVLVYRWDGNNWIQRGFSLLGEAVGDGFGRAVDISSDGNRIMAGAPWNDDAFTNAGHVRVFDWNGRLWQQIGSDIDGLASGDRLGRAISIDATGNRIALGASYHAGGGHARIFDLQSGTWAPWATEISGPGNNSLGFSVSLSSTGETVAVSDATHPILGQYTGLVRA